MTQDTDESGEQVEVAKLCEKCGAEITEPVDRHALEHWIDNHPDDDRLYDVLSGTWVQVDCADCSQAFFSPVSYGTGRIGAESYCPDCNSQGIRKIIVRSLTPAEVIAREADPAEDDLDNRRVFGSETGHDIFESDGES